MLRQSIISVLMLSVVSALVKWETIGAVKVFGDPNLMPLSIIIGGIIGIANMKGLVWGIEGLLGTYKAGSKLVSLSLLRMSIIFTIIIALSLLRLINLLGLLIGMSMVFVIFIKEALKKAKGG